MSIARSASEVLRDHVALGLEAIDRMYLNVYVPHLQTVGAVVGYLRVHRGQRFASTTAVAPMTAAFVRQYRGVRRRRRRRPGYLREGAAQGRCHAGLPAAVHRERGVLYVGKAQEQARMMRMERRRSRTTGGTYPWIVEYTAMVNHYYFYCVDEDFGPFFL